MTFRDWLDTTFTNNAGIYRRDLATIVNTCKEYAAGNVWEAKHTAVAVSLLREVKPPSLTMYPGTVSDEDKEWYKTCIKPNYQQMLDDAIKSLP